MLFPILTTLPGAEPTSVAGRLHVAIVMLVGLCVLAATLLSLFSRDIPDMITVVAIGGFGYVTGTTAANAARETPKL